MNDRTLNLLEAAKNVFARYGVSKTTMNDIAREAGVARQTLYNAYPNKESVLRATLRHGAEETIAAVEKQWRKQTNLSDKLDSFFELGPLFWYDIVQNSPEVADLIDGINSIAHDELIAISKLWNVRFKNLIKAHTSTASKTHFDMSELADFIYSSSINAKYNAQDRSVVEARLRVLKMSVLALLGDTKEA